MAPGDPWFEDLYESSYRRLTLIVLAHGRMSVPDAQEIVQEAFVVAYARRARVYAADNPEAWVCAVALNVARRRWRRRRIADRLTMRDRREAVPDHADVGAEHADLYRAIRALPNGQREAVFLHYLAGLSVADIAARTGRPVGTVKSRLARGREALATVLAPATSPGRSDSTQARKGAAR